MVVKVVGYIHGKGNVEEAVLTVAFLLIYTIQRLDSPPSLLRYTQKHVG